MQDIFSVSASDRTNESTDPSGTLVGLVYMLHEQVRLSWLILVHVPPSGDM
jgi:hypothetical protein